MTKRIISAIFAILVVLSVAVVLPRGQAAAVVGEDTITASGAGVFPTGANFNGIELAGGTFGIGSQTATDGTAVGVVEIQLNGTSVLGLSQWITVTGWITAGTLNADGTITLNGTGTLDMGDGTAPSGGLPFVANVSVSGVQVTIGGTAVPMLPKSDGWIAIE